ncbi:hypothetical protein LUZ60_017778 [Juncus effusus]|nr:hypothetical protein LUZ60_017778 [Juncus effusus]
MTGANYEQEKGKREKPNAHFVLVPFTAPGHTIPMIDIAHILAERGVRISFVTTPSNAVRIKHIIDRVKRTNLPIEFVEINLPSTKFGLPQGCESIENIPSKEHLRPFFEAVYSLSEPLRCFFGSLDSRPHCLITDTFDRWTGPVARKFGIPRVVFHTQSCSYISACHYLEMHKVFDCISDDFESVIVPDFPDKLIVNKDQTPGLINFPGFEDIRKTLLEEESLADAVVINTFEELERPFIEKYERVIGKKVWTIGPSCLYNKDVDMKASRGIEDAVDRL